MYEHYLSKFKPIESEGPFYAIEMMEDPYKGVKLYIGQQFTFADIGTEDRTLRFSYDIFDHPAGFTEDQVTQEFDDLLMGIFLAILEQKMNPQATEVEKGGTSQ